MPDRPVDEDIARKGHQKGSSAKVTRNDDQESGQKRNLSCSEADSARQAASITKLVADFEKQGRVYGFSIYQNLIMQMHAI